MIEEQISKKELDLLLCPYCKKKTEANIEYECGIGTWMICFCLCLFTSCFCFIPLISKRCKDTIYTCVKCKKEIKIKQFEFC